MKRNVNVKTSLNVVPLNILKPALPVIVRGAAAKFTIKVGGHFSKLAKVIFEFNQGDNKEIDDNKYQFSAFELDERGIPDWNEYSEQGVWFEPTIENGRITAINLRASAVFTNLLYENDMQDLMEYNIIVAYKDPTIPTVIKPQPSILVLGGENTDQEYPICSEDLLCSEDLYCNE